MNLVRDGWPDFERPLAGHLDRRFHALGPRGHEIGMGEPARGVADQHLGELFGAAGGIQRGVRVAEPVDLVLHRLDHMGVAVAETGDRRTARAVDHLMPRGVAQPDAAARKRRSAGLRGGCGGRCGSWGGSLAGPSCPRIRVKSAPQPPPPSCSTQCVAEISDGSPSRTISARRSGHIAVMPPTMMPTEPRLENPHSA